MEQKTALDILKSGYNVFITGSAGTGKTYLLNQYIQYLRDRDIIPAIVAPTGIAASHLKGQTIHSFFGIGIREVVESSFIQQLLERKYLRRRFSELDILIIDEVSMVSPELFSSMDRVLQAFKYSDKAFGGVQVVASGDFFQLPPVSKVPKNKRFAWQSPSWRDLDFRTSYLETKFRQDDDKLIKVLDDIRSGIISDLSYEILNARYHYPLDMGYQPTKLYTHNFDVDRINNVELHKLDGDPKVFGHISKGSKKNIEKIFNSSLVLDNLILKKGAVVIFIKNSPDQRYINGTTGVVVGFDSKMDNIPIVKTSSGEKIYASWDDWTIENDSGDVIARVTQIPLRLAWAVTIHKSQGMTLDTAEIDLSKTFEVGQGYVALSRLKSIDGLRLMGLNDMALRVDPLILKIDDRIKSASKRAIKEIEAIEDIKEIQDNHILKSGGDIIHKNIENDNIQFGHINFETSYEVIMLDTSDKEEIVLPKFEPFVEAKKFKNIEKKSKSIKTKKVPTHIQTKNLIEKVESIQELAEIRGLKEGTILGHLVKLRKEDDSLDVSKFKPKSKDHRQRIDRIKETISKDKDEFYRADGKVNMRLVYDALNREVNYEDIFLAILFM
jgi:hypothetical protein